MWDVGKVTPQKLPTLKGIVNLQSGAPKPEENPSLNIQFKIQQLAISGEKGIAQHRFWMSYHSFRRNPVQWHFIGATGHGLTQQGAEPWIRVLCHSLPVYLLIQNTV